MGSLVGWCLPFSASSLLTSQLQKFELGIVVQVTEIIGVPKSLRRHPRHPNRPRRLVEVDACMRQMRGEMAREDADEVCAALIFFTSNLNFYPGTFVLTGAGRSDQG